MTYLDPTVSYLAAVFVGLLLGVGLMLYIRFLQKRFKKAFQKQITPIIFVGFGGSGKTSLLMALTSNMSPITTVTTSVNVWEHDLMQNGEKRKFALIDTVGQNFSSVLEVMPYLYQEYRFKRNPVGALVIVVDVVDVARSNNKPDGLNEIDQERVSRQLSFYNDAVVQLLAGIMEGDGPIILFINKVDAIDDVPSMVRTKAMDAYRPLIDRLAQVRGKRLEVVVGSALTGENVNKLLETVFETT